ncbi:MAG: 50S ribosomal protein L15 [Candidatus Babeliales bacterium]
MIGLHTLKPLLKKRKRVGRGGKLGGTAGKGHKGQKARSGGYVRIGYEGGQMPLYRRLPKRGFNNFQFQVETKVVNLSDLERTFDAGAVIDTQALIEKGLVKIPKGIKNVAVKVLGNGKLSKKFTVSADAFSESALKAIQDCGGEARLIKEM